MWSSGEIHRPEQEFAASQKKGNTYPSEGLILDIGGGGEGIIGQLKGRQVVAIDLLKQELKDAPAGPLLKIVMDARDLKFLDGSFPTATVFFTFMYIQPADHEKVFREIHRALAPGGRLFVWDIVFPRLQDKQKTTAMFPFSIKLPDREVRMGYGVGLREGGLGLPHFEELARSCGFNVVSKNGAQAWFFLELVKPGAERYPAKTIRDRLPGALQTLAAVAKLAVPSSKRSGPSRSMIS